MIPIFLMIFHDCIFNNCTFPNDSIPGKELKHKEEKGDSDSDNENDSLFQKNSLYLRSVILIFKLFLEFRTFFCNTLLNFLIFFGHLLQYARKNSYLIVCCLIYNRCVRHGWIFALFEYRTHGCHGNGH